MRINIGYATHTRLEEREFSLLHQMTYIYTNTMAAYSIHSVHTLLDKGSCM